MGNPQANLVARFESPAPPAPSTARAEVEQPRGFHFAVTWVTLFAHLDLIESNGPSRSPAPARPQAAPILDLVPVVSPPLVETGFGQPGGDPNRDPANGWEMVVPKMIRTGPGQFTPVDSPGRDA